MPMKPHVVAPVSTNSQRPTTTKQHEKGSFVCMRAQNPSGLALVLCAFSAVEESGRKKC